MTTMISLASSQNNNLQDFLAQHNSKTAGISSSTKNITHTRIGEQKLNIYGGSYTIESTELELFYRLYYEHIFVKERKEYLTEKQLDNNGPLLVDFDFRYDFSVTQRIHTHEHVQDIISLYLETLKELFVFEDSKEFPIYIMEKPNVNRVVDKEETKDGIHMIIGIQMDNTIQMILRDRILTQIGDVLDLPLTNNWSNVLDEGITKGCVNWQMYGSQKPGNEAYKLVYHVIAKFNSSDQSFITTVKPVKEFDLSKDLKLLSAQYDKHIKFEMNLNIKEEYNNRLEIKNNKIKKSSSKVKVNLLLENENDNEDNVIELSDINNLQTLTKAVDAIMNSLKTNEYNIKEIHEYTQILPAKYYEPGSHLLNRQVAFALKHTDERLFLSWIMLRSKASDFDYNTIPKLYQDWKTHFKKRPDGLTKRSIIYWAKQDAFTEYELVKNRTIDHYLEETIFDAAEWDYAMVLYYKFKDKYVCSGIKTSTWYVFNGNRWEKDEGMTLRMAISKDLFQLYNQKQTQCLADLHTITNDEERSTKLQRKTKRLAEITLKLKKTSDKNNIMREAMEIFFDKDFIKNVDTNPYLMCFTNGVFDFNKKEFRQGYPQDYITKTTGIPYIKYNYDEQKDLSDEITKFMKELFPQPELCRYMFDHLASCLIGVKKEHAFNIYRGSGSNGKSILTDLMTQSLGEYKGTVPISLVTDKRGSIGGTSSEVIQLKGVRYAVMQEPSKDAVINEGVMKELTGGDPIQARALFSDSEIFIPQFSLVVCTNALFEIKSNDDGTWRRMKLVDFISKFISEGESHTDDTKYVFAKDKSLKEKLPKWAPIFMSMLVKRACETNGEVQDCPEVVSASNNYRQQQDCISGFISTMIIKSPNDSIGKRQLNDVFKEWFITEYGNRKQPPKLRDIEEVMNKKFTRDLKTNKWLGIKIIEEEQSEYLDDLK